MNADIINIEDRDDALHAILERVMLLVPEKDKQDLNLQRIIAFRLKLDGEPETRAYLVKKIEEIIQCAYTGSLYEFLKDDIQEKNASQKKRIQIPRMLRDFLPQYLNTRSRAKHSNILTRRINSRTPSCRT